MYSSLIQPGSPGITRVPPYTPICWAGAMTIGSFGKRSPTGGRSPEATSAASTGASPYSSVRPIAAWYSAGEL